MVKESKIMDCICRFESPLRVREWGFWMDSDRIRIFDCQIIVQSKYVIRLFVDVSKKSLKVLTKNGFQ